MSMLLVRDPPNIALTPVRSHPNSAGTRMPDILISNDGPVRKIRLNRPEKKNALTLAMYEAMAAADENGKCAVDGGRAVVVAGPPGSISPRYNHHPLSHVLERVAHTATLVS